MKTINGIDVSGCDALINLDFCRIGLVDELFMDKYCEFNPDCNYKKYKKTEQEAERCHKVFLEEQNERAKVIEMWREENTKLQEISKILEEFCKDCPCHYDCKNHNLDDENCPCNDILKILKG